MFEGGTVEKPREAAAALAKLLDRELGTKIDPEKFHGFLLMHWHRISTLAHIVHEARDQGAADRQQYDQQRA